VCAGQLRPFANFLELVFFPDRLSLAIHILKKKYNKI